MKEINRLWLKPYGTASIAYSPAAHSGGWWDYQFTISDGSNSIMLDKPMTDAVMKFIAESLEIE